MKTMVDGLIRVLCTALAVVAVLIALSRMSDGAMIYDVSGEFAPSFTNSAAAAFEGSFTFPTLSVTPLTGELTIDGESLKRTFTADMSLNLPRTMMQPWDTRLYSGIDSTGHYMTMLLVNYGPDPGVGTNMLSSELQDGGGWDGWAVSLSDYPVGSVNVMEGIAVNEPAALALAAIGMIIAVGLIRAGKRD